MWPFYASVLWYSFCQINFIWFEAVRVRVQLNYTPSLSLDKHVTAVSQVLFPAETITPHTTVALRLRRHSGACVCRNWLLSGSTGWRSEVDRQAATCPQYSRSSRIELNSGKYDRGLRQHVLHWFNVADRIDWSDSDCASRCSNVSIAWLMDSGYLAELCRPVSSINGHRHIRSARRGQVDVPRVRLST